MNKKSLNIFTVLILMGIMTTLMNFLNSVLASGVGLYYSGLIVHIVGLILSFILFIVLENKEHKPWASTFKKSAAIFRRGHRSCVCAAGFLLYKQYRDVCSYSDDDCRTVFHLLSDRQQRLVWLR